MLRYYRTVDSRITPLDQMEEGCWISAVNPTESEMQKLTAELAVDSAFLRAALDEEETPRIDAQNGQTLVVLDMPVAEKMENGVRFSTMPMGIIVHEKYIVTVSLRESVILTEMVQGVVKNVQTSRRTSFVLLIFMRMAAKYLQYLRQIEKISNYVEKQVHGSLRNQELIQLLDMEKSLIYFSTSLKANEITLEKILRGRIIRLYDEERELLEDVLVEVKQALEMAGIYSGILRTTMTAFTSVIANSYGRSVRTLAWVVVMFAIPAVVFSFFSMNIRLSLPYCALPLLVSAAGMALAGLILFRKKLI